MSNGAAPTYTKWNSGEPNGGGTYAGTGGVIEFPTAVTIGSYRFNSATGHVYAKTNSVPWEDADRMAQAHGADLVTIDDAAENAWVAANMGAGWLGFNNAQKYDHWQWTSGTGGTWDGNQTGGAGTSYTNWNGTEPNGRENENYAEVQSSGGWNDLSTQSRGGIIESPDAVPNTSLTGQRSNPATNYGNSTALDVLHNESSNAWGLVSYLQFDLSDVPANADVGSAKLVLDMYNSYNEYDNTVTVRRVTSEWTEDGVTWDNRPTRDPAISGSRVVHWDDRGPLEWDITGLVTDWHTGRYTNQGMLVAGTTTANSGYYFRSGDYTGGASERPKLVLDFIPAPTYNPLGLEVRQTRYSDWHGFQPDDTLQTLYQAGQATINVSSFQWGSANGVADAASPTNLGGTLGVPIDSQPTGDIDMTFPTTDLGWTLEDIAVHVYNAGDARRYYDFDLLYSTVDDPAAFLLFLTVADVTAPPSIGTTIAIDLDEGGIQSLHTLRLHARHPWGSQSTSWAEIDVNAHPTPEPATCLLLAAGLLGLARRRRRPA